MKTTFVAILLLLVPLVASPAKKLEPGRAKPNVACSVAYWRPASTVSVYFVRGMFTHEQRQDLLDVMGTSEETATKMELAVTFNYAGETDGLIDCESCLTVARQQLEPTDRKVPATVNALRRNELGQLISAWIGVNRATNSSVGLRRSMLEALRGVRGTKALSTCKK